MQNDFMPWGALPVAGADTLVPYINRLMGAFPEIIASQDWHPKGHMSFASTHGKKPFTTIEQSGMKQMLWPDHCVQDSNGAAFVSGLQVEKCTKIVRKGCDIDVDSYSAFFDNGRKRETDLNVYCKEKGIQELTVVGVALEYCVLFSVLDALALGYGVSVDVKGCRGIEAEKGDCKKAIEKMRRGGAQILD